MHFGMGLPKVLRSVRRLIVTSRSHVHGKACGVCVNIRDTFLVTDRPYTRAHTNIK